FDRDAVGDIAQPHMRLDGVHVAYALDPPRVPEITSAAAGGIRCGLEDMLEWARAWLDADRAPDWLSAEQRKAMWTAHTPLPVPARHHDRGRTHAGGHGASRGGRPGAGRGG